MPLTKTHCSPGVYFGRADGASAGLMTYDDFVKSFLDELLFHGDLLVTDVFWYSNWHLHSFVRSPKAQGFLREALRGGDVQPVFRDPGNKTGDFGTNLLAILDDGIRGVIRDSENTASILNSFVSDGPSSYRFSFWPEETHLATAFGTRLAETFRRDQEVRFPTNSDVELWGEMHSWLFPCFEKTSQSAAGGIKRGSLYEVVADSLGVPPNEERKGLHLKEVMRSEAVNTGGPQKLAALDAFLSLVDQTYQLNQAHAFAKSCSQLEVASIYTGSEYRKLANFALLPDVAEPNEIDMLPLTLPVPSVEDILAHSAAILSVRKSEGQEYFTGLTQWRMGANNDADVCRAASKYCEALCKAASPTNPPNGLNGLLYRIKQECSTPLDPELLIFSLATEEYMRQFQGFQHWPPVLTLSIIGLRKCGLLLGCVHEQFQAYKPNEWTTVAVRRPRGLSKENCSIVLRTNDLLL